MSDADTPADRAYVTLSVERLSDRFAQAAAEMQADLDAYRDDWSSRHAEQVRTHNERVRQIKADQAAWFKSWYDGDPDESAPTDVGQGHGASVSVPAPAPGRGPGQPISAAEMLEAEAIKNMSMQEYAALRAELGVRSPTDMNRLFGDAR